MRLGGTWAELLTRSAQRAPEEVAFRFLRDGERDEAAFTRGALDVRAKAVGALLQSENAVGAPVLLLCAPGLDYIAALFGCLYAGAIAVPAYPPRLNRSLPRLLSILADSRSTIVLTTRALARRVQALVDETPALRGLRFLTVDDLDDGAADGWRAPRQGEDSPALIQYTSGSTASPRGVVLSHRNLFHNCEAIYTGFGHGPQSSVVSWLPPYHDMGLVGCLLMPLYGGFPATTMAPIDFLRRPARWLEAITRYRATSTGGPNFAYDLCTRKVSEAERASLDLASWTVAVNGAEPVRTETLDRFQRMFGPCGFRAETMHPCYGLAETTLIASFRRTRRSTLVRSFDRRLLERGTAAAATGDDRPLVGCGEALVGHEICIVDRDTRRLVADGGVGEIWIRGPSVALGYWERPEETREAFQAHPEDTTEGPFLRTGDLGFLHEGELFVTGRCKDLLILRGRNVYPQDVEAIAERTHPAVRANAAAVFSVDAEGEERAVLVLEVDLHKGNDPAAIIDAVRGAISEAEEVMLYSVVLIRPGTLPKTSSGKVRRSACKEAFLEGRLEAVFTSTLDDADASPESGAEMPARKRLLAVSRVEAISLLRAYLRDQVAALLSTHPERIDEEAPLVSLGFDSLLAVRLTNTVEAHLGVSFASTNFPGDCSVRQLAAIAWDEFDAHLADSLPPLTLAARDESLPLSFAQYRLWVLDQLEPGRPTYNIPMAMRLRGRLDVSAMARALRGLVDRHEALRTTIETTTDGEPIQVVSAATRFDLAVVDLSNLEDTARRSDVEMRTRTEALAPFDLSCDLPFRATLLRESDDDHVLLLTAHHVACDGWSIGILVEELSSFYSSFRSDQAPSLTPLAVQYADYSVWQRRCLQGPLLHDQVLYWTEQLEGAPPSLDLPTDRPRPPVQSFAGAAHAFAVSRAVLGDLDALCRERGVTLYMALLAAFQALLHRYTGQTDLVLGSPIANRNRAELENLVGFFVNTVALRVDLSNSPTFVNLLQRVRPVCLGAFAHQDLPFERLVEELGPKRDQSRSPIFQVVFAFQNVLSRELRLPGLTVSPAGAPVSISKYDLWLGMERADGRLQGVLEYNTDLFDAATIERMAQHFVALLGAVVADPNVPITDVEILAPSERALVLDGWNQTSMSVEDGVCAHALFEQHARRTPEAVALVFDGREMTYGELNRRSNAVATFLRTLGVRPEVRVGLCTDRTFDSVVGVLAILKAGGAYVPIDPAYPTERISFLLEDSRVPIVLTQEHLAERLPELGARVLCVDRELADLPEADDDLQSGVVPRNLAYVIYTSGSTGRPKGAMLEHRGLCNLVRAQARAFGVRSGDRILQFASLSFDASVWEIFMAIGLGATLDLGREGSQVSGSALFSLLHDGKIGIATLPPSILGTLPREPLPDLHTLIVAGEACPPELARHWADGRTFVNAYGPTEATVCASLTPCTEDILPPNIGRPILNARLYVLDGRLRPVPVGVEGDLYLAGLGLARGYLDRPDLTAELFLPDPFGTDGGRLYSTGDRARRRADGSVEYRGRLDDQVKLRGMRIELGEIEHVIRSETAVDRAVVLIREVAPGDERLVAYYTPKSAAGPLTPADLRRALQHRLPDYMVPAAFVELDGFPTTPNGKLDRAALPLPDSASAAGAVAPRTPTEFQIARIFEELLHIGNVGATDGFFDLGGHSLLATQLTSRLGRLFGVDVPLRTVFERSTVEALAHAVDGARAGGGSAPGVAIERATEGPWPLSFAQRRLWFLDQLEPGQTTYSIPIALRLRGALDSTVLAGALQDLVTRHEVLRTTFQVVDFEPVQVIGNASDWRPGYVDLTRREDAERGGELERIVLEEARTPFDLQTGPMFRATIVRCGPRDHVLLLTIHHIVSDAWSMMVLVEDLATLYQVRRAASPPPTFGPSIRYVDYAAWQRSLLEGARLRDLVEYWKDQLQGAPSRLDLPTDRPRPRLQTYSGATVSFRLEPELAKDLVDLASGHGATTFIVLLAAFQVLLYRHTGQRDIVVGSPVANRTRIELEQLVGLFVNTLPMRARLAPGSKFSEVLARARETALGAYAHQDLPFERLVEELRIPRDLGRPPVFQVMFDLQNAPVTQPRLDGLDVEMLPSPLEFAKFDLTLSFREIDGSLEGAFEYNRELFAATTIARMVERTKVLLQSIVDGPERSIDELDVLSPGEREALVRVSTGARAPRSGRLLHDFFEAQARATPSATALVFEDREIGYGELEANANRLARVLRARGVGPEAVVGLCLERSPELITAMLAVLKAGGVYLPLDPRLPAARLSLMVRDAAASLVLTSGAWLGQLTSEADRVVSIDSLEASLDQQTSEALPDRARPAQLAYVLYTSGSTGVPKAVAVSHAAIRNHLEWMGELWHLGPRDTVLQSTAPSFDVSVWEIFGALGAGARLVLVPPDRDGSVERLAELIRDQKVTALQAVPALLGALLEQPAFRAATTVGRIGVGGDELRASLARRLTERMPGAIVVNFYGPTEATIDASYHSLHSGRPEARAAVAPIGVPLPNVRLYVLDESMHLAPPGVAGELFVAGAGLARGYLRHPDWTAAAFVPDPFSEEGGARMYRTGDLARIAAEGRFEFLGRIDRQIKLRGLRIELGEIESALSTIPAIRHAAVEVHEVSSDERRLVAYYESAIGGEISPGDIRNQLRGKLPSYMIPTELVALSRLPTTATGKVDRASLRSLSGASSTLRPPRLPRTTTEARLAELVAKVLLLPSIDLEDNFFDIGGHSLLATQVVARIRQVFGVEVSLRALFEAESIAALADLVEGAASTSVPRPAARASADEPPCLSFAQERLWILDRLHPTQVAYNVPFAARLRGALDEDALERALSELVRRHEVLRCTFPAIEGRPSARVGGESSLALRRTDLASLQGSGDRVIKDWILEESSRPFDLATEPMVRAHLLRCGPAEAVLLLLMHHIVTDGWSTGVAMREIAALYDAFRQRSPSPLPELSLQYSDYARWQRQWLQAGALEDKLAPMLARLRDVPATLDLPTDRVRPAVQTYAGSSLAFSIPEDIAGALVDLSEAEGATLYMTLLAAFQVLLFRYTGQSDFVVGSPIANRSRPEFEGLIGFFVNTLAIRADLAGDPDFRCLLSRVRTATLEAYAHQDVPFEKVVEALNPDRQLSRTPLFQVMFVLQNTPAAEPELSGLDIQPFEPETRSSKFELTFMLERAQLGLSGIVEYNTDLFDKRTIERMVGHYRRLLDCIAAQPSQRISELSLIEAEERRRLLVECNETRRDYPPVRAVQDLVDEQALAEPERIAATFEGTSLTYGELRARSSDLALRLRRLGVSPDVPVGLFLERSLEMVVGVLGILKSGGAYLPLDPTDPVARTSFVVNDAHVHAVITSSQYEQAARGLGRPVVLLEGRLSSLSEGERPSANGSDQGLAYVIYTSGSTGKPKGTMNTHGGLRNRLQWMQDAFPLTPADRVLHKTPLTFDVSIWEILWPLMTGAQMVIARPGGHRDPKYLGALVRQAGVTTAHFVPSMLEVFLSEEGLRGCPSVRQVFSSGEALWPDLVNEFFEQTGAGLHNLYGPTEASIDVSHWACRPMPARAPVPIGRPIANTQLYVVDHHFAPVPIGVAGDLLIGGVSLARGYLGQADMTAECFVPNPFGAHAGDRLYRTGDRARFREDGAIEFLGRADRQVKVRGVRIELGEVEGALRELPEVDQVVVIGADEPGGGKRLVAYFTSSLSNEQMSLVSLLNALKTKLPDVMIPTAWMRLPQIPLTTSGKVDVRVLPTADPLRSEMRAPFVAPRTETEAAIAELAAEVLEISAVGIHDNFFHLGGHSLLAVRFSAKLRDRFGVELPLRLLFESPTVAGLASEVDVRMSDRGETSAPIRPLARGAYRRSVASLDPSISQAGASAGARMDDDPGQG